MQSICSCVTLIKKGIYEVVKCEKCGRLVCSGDSIVVEDNSFMRLCLRCYREYIGDLDRIRNVYGD